MRKKNKKEDNDEDENKENYEGENKARVDLSLIRASPTPFTLRL